MPNSEYIIFWKDSPGQQVHTVVDSHNQPVRRSNEYLAVNDVVTLTSAQDVLTALEAADGTKYGIEPELASAVLGWDV